MIRLQLFKTTGPTGTERQADTGEAPSAKKKTEDCTARNHVPCGESCRTREKLDTGLWEEADDPCAGLRPVADVPVESAEDTLKSDEEAGRTEKDTISAKAEGSVTLKKWN